MGVAAITAWFGNRNVKRGLLLLTFGYALVVMIAFPRLNSDTTFQLGQVQSYLKGHGFTVAVVSPDDLSKVEYLPNRDFAAGYLLVITPLMKWFGFMPSVVVVNMLAVLMLLGVCYGFDALLNRYTGPLLLPLLLVFFVTSPLLYQFCAATDLLSLAFFMLSILLAIRLINGVNPGGTELRYVYLAIGVGLTAYLCCFFRYAYYFMMFVPILVLGLYGMVYKQRLWKSFFIALGVLLLLLSVQVLLHSGSNYIKSRHGSLALKTLHWENLLKFDNFIFNSLVNETSAEFMLSTKLHLPPPLAQGVILLFTVLIAGGLVPGLLYLMRHETGTQKLRQAMGRPIVMLGVIGAMVGLVNVAFLTMLSLCFEAYKSASWQAWTYVEETRYYAPVSFLILVFLLLILLYRGGARPKALQWVAGTLLAVALLANLYQHAGGLLTFLRGRTDGIITNLAMAHLISNSPNRQVVFVTPDLGANYTEYALAVGAAACHILTFQQTDGRCLQPVSLYLAIPSKLAPDLQRAMREQVARLNARRVARVRAHGVTELYYLPDYLKK